LLSSDPKLASERYSGGKTALHISCSLGNSETVTVLLPKGMALLAFALFLFSSSVRAQNGDFLSSFKDLLKASSPYSPAPTPSTDRDDWLGNNGFDGPAGELRDELKVLDDRHSGDTIQPDCSVPGAPCVGKGDAQYCGGQTAKGATQWTVFGEHRTNALMLHVDTSACGYRNTPIYLTNVVGDASVPLTVSVLLYSFTPVSLRVLVSHESMSAADVLPFARAQWTLSWMGATGRNCGITGFFKNQKPAGWQQKPSAPSLLYLDVDTSAKGGVGGAVIEGASFRRPTSVRYFTSFVARKLHWRGENARLPMYRLLGPVSPPPPPPPPPPTPLPLNRHPC
jgi:hypothetical protein